MQGEGTPRILRQPDRKYDVLGRQLPRNPFHGAAGLRLLLGLGLAELFEKEVPPQHVVAASDVETRETIHTVHCTCGERIVCKPQAVTICPSDCGVWLLSVQDAVLVKRWPREVAA